jgi:uncharacterized membrane protein
LQFIVLFQVFLHVFQAQLSCCGESRWWVTAMSVVSYMGRVSGFTCWTVGDQVVLARQPFFNLVFQPLLTFVVLAMGAIAVTTGMGNIDPLTALVIRTASQHVQTMLVATSGHGLQRLDMAWQEIFLVGAEEAVLESVDDRGE